MALEVTGSCWEVARILEPHVNRVIVVSPDDTGIASARAKTDKLDARALASCGGRASSTRCGCPMSAAGSCVVGSRAASSSCERARARRTRSRRCCSGGCERPPFADLFGVKGRRWLAEVELPVEERESVDAGLRQIAFLDAEIAAVDRLIAQQALAWPEIRRLMTVPGVNLICAATFFAAIGRADRFLTSRKLVAYLGLDPKVRQSGEAPARSGRISKRGSASARWALVEAAWSVVKQPGPLRAFYERVRARRGHGKSDRRDRPQARGPVLVHAHPLRGLRPPAARADQEEAARARADRRRAKPRTKAAAGIWSTNRAIRDAERALAEQAEVSYKRMVTDQQAGRPSRKVGASATPERA